MVVAALAVDADKTSHFGGYPTFGIGAEAPAGVPVAGIERALKTDSAETQPGFGEEQGKHDAHHGAQTGQSEPPQDTGDRAKMVRLRRWHR